MIVVDTSVLYAFFVADDPAHGQAAQLLTDGDEVCVVSPYVIAELDYFMLKRFGSRGEEAMFRELTEGPYELAQMQSRDVIACASLLAEFPDHAIGVTDASLVVLADRYQTTRIATLDRRHFRIMRTLDGAPFTLLP